MPEWAAANIDQFRRLNPDYDIRVHGKEVLLSCFETLYAGMTLPAMKSDLLRLSALKRYGGWYFDVDFWPFRSLDDAVNAFGIDGRRLFISGQRNNKNPRYAIAATPLAIAADNGGVMDMIIEQALAVNKTGANAYGPELIGGFYAAHTPLCVKIGSQWFFPANQKRAGALYPLLRKGYDDHIYHLCADTGGQKPFAMHLWAHGKVDLAGPVEPVETVGSGDRLAGVIVTGSQKRQMSVENSHPGGCINNVVSGLIAKGYRVEVAVDDAEWPCFSQRPEVIAVWNGLRPPLCEKVQLAECEGIPVYRFENGFMGRKQNCQCDKKGILHWASFARHLKDPAPEGADERFRRVWPRPIVPMHPNRVRRSGMVLVLGQTVGDTQLDASEIKKPIELDRAVFRALNGTGIKAFFRPHPLDRRHETRKRYLPVAEHPTLDAALAEAKMVITINSNAGVEALASGVPVLCFGPATYEMAGVARKTTLKTLRSDILDMLDGGGLPCAEDVANYLYHLAANQYSLDEIRRGVCFNRNHDAEFTEQWTGLAGAESLGVLQQPGCVPTR